MQHPSLDDALPESLAAALAAARQKPHDESAWDELEDLTRELDRPDEAAQLYREVLQAACAESSTEHDGLTPEQVDELGRRAVDYHEEWFEDPALAIELLETLAAYCVDDWAFERLTLILTMGERWDALLAQYDSALARVSDGEGKLKLLDEAARIAKDFANQGDRASDYLMQLLSNTPDNDTLAVSLERRLEQQERHSDLVQMWQLRLAVLRDEAARNTRTQIAQRLLVQLKDAPAALEFIEQLLATDGQQAACELLEQLANGESYELGARRRALQLLREQYSATQRPEDELRVLRLAIDLAENDTQRLAFHRDCTDVLLRGDRLEEALEHAASRFVLDPTDEDSHQQVRELSENVQLPQRYCNALKDAAARCPEHERRINLLVESGQVCETQVRDASAAIAQYLEILGDEAAPLGPQLLVARRLRPLLVEAAGTEGLAEEARRSAETQLLAVLERLAELETEKDARRDALSEAAKLSDRLEEVDRALSLWQQCLELNQDDTRALDARISILERVERWEPLIEDLKKRAENSTQEEHQRSDLVRVARLFETRLFRLEDAIAIWKDIEDLFGSNAQTVDALVDLNAASGQAANVIALLSEAVKTETDAERRTAQLARLGDVYREQDGETLKAVDCYRQALAVDSVHDGARSGLRALIRDPQCAAEALETLATSLLEADEWPGVLELAELRIEASTDPEKTFSLLTQAAELMEQRAQDPAGSLEYLCRAFELKCNETLEAEVQRLARSSGQWKTAVEGYQKAISRCSDESRARQLRFVHGQLLESRLGEQRAALDSYRKILDSDPTHLPATSAIARVATEIGAFGELAWVVLHHAKAVGELDPEVAMAVAEAASAQRTWEQTTSALFEALANAETLEPKVSHDLCCQLALWFRDHRADAKTAERLFAQAVEAQQEVSTLRLLAELQRQSPSPALVGTLLMLADGVEHKLPVLYEASQVSLQHVTDEAVTRPIVERTLKSASDAMTLQDSPPSDSDSVDATEVANFCTHNLVQMARVAGDYQRALQLLESASKLPFSADRQLELTFEAAKVAAENLHLPDRTVSLCNGILERQPGHAEAIALLGGVLETEGRHQELLSLRQAELGLQPELDRRLFLRLEQARILAQLEADDSERIQALQQNVDESPGHAASIELLGEILSSSEKYGELADLLSEQAKRVAKEERHEQAATLWAQAAALCEQHLEDTARAGEAYRNSVELSPSVVVLDNLARLSIDAHQHDAAVQWLTQRINLTPLDEREDRRRTIVSLAKELRTCNRIDDARRYLEQGLKDDPASVEIRHLLSELYREAGDWALLAPTLSQGAEFAEDPKQKVTYLRHAARVQRQQLNQLDEAIPLLERAVQLEPNDRPLRLSLADGLRHAARHDEARQLLEQLLGEFGRRRTPERARVHYHLAQIARATGNLDVALSELDLASKVDRNNVEMLQLLGTVAREKGQLAEAERAYRTLLLLIGRQRQEGNPEGAGIGESSVLFELHRIAQEQGQEERARELLDSALEAGSHHADEAKRLEQALRDAGQHQLLLQALESRLSRTEDAREKADIYRDQADTFKSLERTGDALKALLCALEQQPTDTELLAAVWQLGDELQQLDTLCSELESLSETIAKSEPEAACRLSLSVGAKCQQQGKLEAAAKLYSQAQRTGHQPAACLDALLTLGIEEKPAEAAEAYRLYVAHEVGAEDDERFTSSLMALARLELQLQQPAQAAELVERSWSRGYAAEQCMELLLSACEQPAPSEEVVALLARIARSVDEPQSLIAAIASGATLGCFKMPALREGFDLAASHQRDPQGRQILEGAVALADREDLWNDAVWAITALAQRLQDDQQPERAATLLERSIEKVSEAQSLPLRRQLADLAMDTLEDLPKAASVLEQLLDRLPTDSTVWRPLLNLYRKLQQPEKLKECLAKVEEASTDDEQLQSLQLERIRILVDSDQKQEAESLLASFIETHPSVEEASDLLEELFEQQDRLGELHQMLEQRLAAAREQGDSQAIVRRTLRLGNVLGSSDPVAALEIYRASLRQVADDVSLLEAFLGLLQADEHLDERLETLTRLVQVAAPERAEACALQLVNSHRDRQNPDAVRAALQLGLERVPDSAPLHEARVAWFKDLEDWENLAFALRAQADALPPGEASLAIRRQATDIYLQQLEDPIGAAETLSAGLDPNNPDPQRLSQVADLWLLAERRPQALEYLSLAIDAHTADAPGLAQLLKTRGNLHREMDSESLEHLAAAADDLQRVAELAPQSDTRVLAEVLENMLSLQRNHGVPEQEQGPTIMRLAKVLQGLDELDPAAALLQDWLSLHPDDKAAQRQLAGLAASREDWLTAAEAYRGLIPLCEGDDQVDAALHLAEACEKSEDPLGAREALEEAYSNNPHSERLRACLRQMYEAAGEHHGWASLLMNEAQSAEDAANRYSLLCAAGDLFMRADDAKQEAFAAYEQALEVRNDPETLVKAVDAQVALGEVEEAARRLDEAIRAHGKRRSPQLSALQYAMAKVADAAGDDEAIFAWLEAALYSDRQNGVVASELASLAMSRGEFDVAVKALQLVTLLKSPGPMSRAEAYLRQAVIARHRGDSKKSALLAKRAVNTDPEYADAQKFLDDLQADG